MSEPAVFTYQSRLAVDAHEAGLLDAYAHLFGRAERALHAALQRPGVERNALKREFLQRFGLTARQYNAVKVTLEGKLDSIRARQPDLIAQAAARIERAERTVGRLQARGSSPDKLHQKRRRLAALLARAARLKADHEASRVRICFGSRRLFHAQFDLQANGLADHTQWQHKWRQSRSSQFFVLGSQDETAGNQSCQASVAEDGTLRLALRLPAGISDAKTLTLSGVRFAYGHEQITAALQRSMRVPHRTGGGTLTTKRVGSALSYRFLRDERGWRVFASVQVPPPQLVTSAAAGAIGVDVNADHLAVSEVDRFGNLVRTWRMPLCTYGKSAEQAKALIGDAAVAIAVRAAAAGKPLVLEKLDFQRKKAQLEGQDPKIARMLSSFFCSRVQQALRAASFRAAVATIEVNAAYTSTIGAVNHAQRHGISVHQAAAVSIARRGLGLSEKPATRAGAVFVPTRNGGHVTLDLPERNRSRHVWSLWAAVRKKLKAAHAAQIRSGVALGPPAPLIPVTGSASSTWALRVRSPHANRPQHCSADVMDERPLRG